MSANEEVASFGRAKSLQGRTEMETAPTPFPSAERGQEEVWAELNEKLARNLPPERNWASYASQAHEFAKRVFALPEAIDSYAIEFYREIYPGVLEMSQQAVRMIGSLLNAADPYGFITTGGTEANLLAVRLARNLGAVERPQLIVPLTRHYSFDLGAELFGVELAVAPLDGDDRLDAAAAAALVNENTVGIVCTAPEMFLGRLDPVAEIAAIAERHDLYMHVDAAIGGFMLPFLERLGRPIPPFDFRHPAVCSMTVDPHKLGMCPKPAGALILRDRSLLDRGIDLERVTIDTLVASGRPGAATAAVWAMIQHLGEEGYMRMVADQMALVDLIAETVSELPGMRLLVPPETNIVCFTGDDEERLEAISRELWRRRWAVPLNMLPGSGERHFRIFVHPLKRRAAAEELLADLAAAVEASG